jgi:hypothetical protein
MRRLHSLGGIGDASGKGLTRVQVSERTEIDFPVATVCRGALIAARNGDSGIDDSLKHLELAPAAQGRDTEACRTLNPFAGPGDLKGCAAGSNNGGSNSSVSRVSTGYLFIR